MRIISIIVFLVLSGCSAIDRRSTIENHKLQIGQAIKSQVVDQIGLPNKVEHRNSQEYWLYSGKESRSDLFIPLPIGATGVGSGTYQVYYTDIGPSKTLTFEPILVCVFDKDGVLINAFKPEKKEI